MICGIGVSNLTIVNMDIVLNFHQDSNRTVFGTSEREFN
jgi:hypothetical protein